MVPFYDSHLDQGNEKFWKDFWDDLALPLKYFFKWDYLSLEFI